MKLSQSAKIACVVCAVGLTAVVQAQDFIWTTNVDGTLNIKGYIGTSTVVTIPSMTNGLTVTSIGVGAFYEFLGNTPPSSVTMPDTVTSIGVAAFEEDSLLTSITIPNGVTSIAPDTFYQCTRLTNVTLGTNTASIGVAAFSRSGLTSFTIPSTVTNIGGSAFSYSGLTSITIPTSVTDIGNSAFASCGSLTNVAMGSNVTTIEGGAFSGSGLTGITIPTSVTNIGGAAFGGCASLTAIAVDTNNLFYSSLDGVLFDKNQTTLIQYPNGKVGNFTIPSTVTNIGSGAFSGSGLTSITIPTSVTDIGNSAFASCGSLSNVAMGSNVTTIEGGAFSGSGLTSITIPTSVTNIGGGAFGGCASLAAITVDTNNLFYSSLDGVLFDKNQTTLIQYPNGKVGNFIIPNTITSVGLQFEGLTNLTGITIPDSVTNIATYAFYQCESLTNVSIGNNVTSIGQSTFMECGSLAWVTMGKSIKYIGLAAFDFGGSLQGILFQGSPPYIWLPLFDANPNLVFYYLPGATGWIPQVLTTDGKFGVRNNQFGFTVGGTNGLTIVVQASTSLEQAVWVPMSTNTFGGGTMYFSDPQWFNYSAHFYRVRSIGYDGYPAVPWNPQVQTKGGSFGVQNGQFGFTINGTANIPIVVEGCTNVANASWTALQSCTLTNGSIYFSDAQWTNYPARFYRLRFP